MFNRAKVSKKISDSRTAKFSSVNAKTLVAGLAALFVLSACAYAPGSHMEPEKASDDLEGQVLFHSITPQLIADLRKPRISPEANPELEQAQANYDYRVGKGDVLTVTVWNHPELTIPAGSQRSAEEAGNWVHNDGTIFYPYIGRVHVDGLMVTEIQELITERLSRFIEDPQVDVTVAAFRSKRVYVTGEVNQPGTQPVTNVPMTLLDAVNRSGGITEMADWRNVVLTRNGVEQRFSLQDLYTRGDTTQNTLLQHGDLVHVERNDVNKVFVLGEVNDASSVPVNRSRMTLAEALAEAGGVSEQRADASGIFVFREAPEGADYVVDVYQLNVKQATSYVLADQFELQPRDIIFVTAAPVARWNRVISLIMPTVTGLYQVARTDGEIRD
ncbi:polysaccharide export protein Wza [Aliidiomarina iranensis]|uniref:Polysaccharide export protein Wza n=1 Tax=Aliidiomarina iranensis TaxID=1434071 RepID=A0A432VT92_9GAMM|nr:polysaccharide export protein [Aliidiomarina iranensis]RUO19635.1 polysaccharide export protein Wza [Aliidiomarina iranensis]